MKSATQTLCQLSLCALAVLSLGAQATVVSSTGSALSIPDNKSAGVSSTISLDDVGKLTGLSVTVALNHKNLGDLTATLKHGNTSVVLLKNVKKRSSSDVAPYDLLAAYPLTFSANASYLSSAIGSGCEDSYVIGASGSSKCKTTLFKPLEGFTPFYGELVAGDWTLTLSDTRYNKIYGSLSSWSMSFDAEAPPAPAPSNVVYHIPEPDSLAIVGLALFAVGMTRSSLRRRAP